MQRELSLLVGVESQVMPIFHLSQLQLEFRRRPFAGMMIPPVGGQDTADIQKRAGDCSRFLHRLFLVDRIIAATGFVRFPVGLQGRSAAV